MNGGQVSIYLYKSLLSGTLEIVHSTTGMLYIEIFKQLPPYVQANIL